MVQAAVQIIGIEKNWRQQFKIRRQYVKHLKNEKFVGSKIATFSA